MGGAGLPGMSSARIFRYFKTRPEIIRLAVMPHRSACREAPSLRGLMVAGAGGGDFSGLADGTPKNWRRPPEGGLCEA
jgi:hypothetical protein